MERLAECGNGAGIADAAESGSGGDAEIRFVALEDFDEGVGEPGFRMAAGNGDDGLVADVEAGVGKAFKQFLDVEGAGRFGHAFSDGDSGVFVLGDAVADERLEGEEGIAAEEHAGESSGRDGVFGVNAAEHSRGGEDEDETGDEDRSIGIEGEEEPVTAECAAGVENMSGDEGGGPGGDAGAGIMDGHVLSLFCGGHDAHEEVSEEADLPAEGDDPPDDREDHGGGTAPGAVPGREPPAEGEEE